MVTSPSTRFSLIYSARARVRFLGFGAVAAAGPFSISAAVATQTHESTATQASWPRPLSPWRQRKAVLSLIYAVVRAGCIGRLIDGGQIRFQGV